MSSYNYGRFISAAIDSVLGQSVGAEDSEIIVIDDGSTDDTASICRKYNGRIRYVYKSNGGHASGLNAGYALSSGEIIVFLDPDDYCAEDKFEKISGTYERLGAEAVFHNLGIVNEEGIVKKTMFDADDISGFRIYEKEPDVIELSMDNVARAHKLLTVLSGQTYKRSLLDKIFPLPSLYTKNTDFFIRTRAILASRILYLHETLGFYRQHPYSHMAVTKRDAKEMEKTMFLMKELNRELMPKARIDARVKRLVDIYEDFALEHEIAINKRKGRNIPAIAALVKFKSDDTYIKRMKRRLRFLAYILLPEEVFNSLVK